MARFALCSLALLAGGCFISHGRGGNPPDAGPRSDADLDAPARPDHRSEVDAGHERSAEGGTGRDAAGDDAGPLERLVCEDPIGVDLLLVLDDSGSFRPDDAILRDRLERMLRRLLRPPDLDHDGVEDWARVEDLHVGIVSTSLVGPGFCATAADGALRRGRGAGFPSCTDEAYPAYQTFAPGDDPRALIDDTVCVAFGPRTGCQVEQPLEAIAKALLPRDAPFSFLVGEARGDTDNAGFLRPDSVLVVLVFTDEDDCSVRDPRIFQLPDAGPRDPIVDGGPGPGAPGCRAGGWGLYPPTRYRQVIDHLRPTHPDRLVFGFVGGIDPAYTTSFAGDLGSCGHDPYPDRLVRVARALPGRSLAGSSCHLAEIEFVQSVAARVGAAACPD